MVPLLPILFAIAVQTTPSPPLSPEPLVHEPPPTTINITNRAWDQTHDSDFVPAALLPKPEPKPLQSASASSSKPKPTGDTGMGSNVEQWRDLVTQYFPGEVEMALCVIAGESGGNPNAQNPRSSAAGLWQFLRSTWDKMVPRDVTGGSYDSGAVLDPVAATRAAAWLRHAAGWSQWNAAARCR